MPLRLVFDQCQNLESVVASSDVPDVALRKLIARLKPRLLKVRTAFLQYRSFRMLLEALTNKYFFLRGTQRMGNSAFKTGVTSFYAPVVVVHLI